ncbi:MAG: hypothetical protein JSR61_19995 [Proteobacteria bacterium]|nr:hypothetical protein [Pseudomonadota bacterium]
MALREDVFAAADALFLRRLTFDLSVHDVRPISGGRLRSVGAHFKEWKRDRRALAAQMPKAVREQIVELAERVFVCGVIVSNGRPPEAAPAESAPSVRTRAAPVRTEILDDTPDNSDAIDRSLTAMFGAQSVDEKRAVPKGPAPSVWRRAANPRLAQAAAQVLRNAGFPLRAADINAKLPKRLRVLPPRKTWRDIPAALEGSKLEAVDGKWWFAGEQRPQRPKKRYWKLSKSDLARTRRDSPIVFDGILEHLRSVGTPLAIGEMLRWARENLDVPEAGNYDYTWLRQLLRRTAEKEPHLVKQGSKYRWLARPPSKR